MLKNIEKTFNRIWRARENRRGLTSFLLYWAVLSLGPVLLGIGALISTYLTSQSLLAVIGITGTIRSTLLAWMPLLLSALTFTLLFVAVPNCRVPIRHAAIGGLLTALLFEVGKKGFAWAVSLSSYQVIYGAFAAIPLFLLWIYLSWLLILAGAEFVRALSSFNSSHASRGSSVTVALAVLERFFRAQIRGEVINEAELLNGRWVLGQSRLGIEEWESLRNTFVEARILRLTDEGEYLLGRNLAKLQLSELFTLLVAPELGHACDTGQAQTDNSSAPHWYDRVRKLVAEAETGLLQVLDLPVASLFEQTPDDEEPSHLQSVR